MNHIVKAVETSSSTLQIDELLNSDCELCSAKIHEITEHLGKSRVIVHSTWSSHSGLIFALQLAYRYEKSDDHTRVWADYRAEPKLINDRILDEFGFELPTYRFKRLAWDLLLKIDTAELEKQIINLLDKRH